MPMIGPCIEPGCSKLCMGLFCIEHDSRPSVDFPRGRPWPPLRAAAQPPVAVAARFAAARFQRRASVRPVA
jgi:hypothetical protein